MRKALTVSVAALTAVSAVAFSTAASAADYYRDNDNEVGAAIIGGVLGFVLGSAVSSSSRNRYGYSSSPYYGGSYGSPYGYGSGSYGYGSSPYYGGSYGSYGYGSQPYYGGSYGYGSSPYYGSGYGGYGYNSYCRTVTRRDPYTGRYVRYQSC